ncbi:hypothetical protein ACHAXT_002679 [Thalassiosira profunda]
MHYLMLSFLQVKYSARLYQNFCSMLRLPLREIGLRHLRRGRSAAAASPIPSASFSSKSSLPESANVVVIGGGIIGTSVAYHLGKLGVDNVLLLERDQLTSGTTWHAAGLINTFGSLSSTSTEMRTYTKKLYAEILPEETGASCGFLDVGFIELACDLDRLHYYRRVAASNRYCGVDVREITSEEVNERFPLCETGDVLAGFHVADDGRANPHEATMALAKGARQNGVEIYEGVAVDSVTTSKDGALLPKVSGVKLANGRHIAANAVVNCAGMWARQLGERDGVCIPNQAAEHYYLLTDPIPEVDPSWPVIEDSSKCVYVRPEGGGLMIGFFESAGAPWNVNAIPGDFSFGEITADWERMGPYLEEAMKRVPISETVGVKSLFCGPESFTPDGCPIVGESPEIRNYYVAAGLNSIGILTGGGIGRIVAQWVRDGRAPSNVDVTGIAPSRFHRYQNTPNYRAKRAGETLGNTYKVHYPDKQPTTCRGVKRSALHDRLAGQNAHFRDVSGWESPSWYAPDAEQAKIEQHSFRREHWFPYWEAEHRSCRERVALFDMSFMSKFRVDGRDAGRLLNRLSTANIDGPAGQITYCQWLNEDGRMEADLTVTKLNEESFLVVATDTMHNHTLSLMQRQITEDMHAFVHDMTGAYTQINLQGPQSRALLQRLTSCDLDDFPFRSVAEIDIGYALVLCARITYVGELGYELYIPTEHACHVYDAIVAAGADFGLTHAGLRALGSLRMEKAYRDYGHDMDNTDTLLEVGLGFTCDFEKERGFIGMERVLEEKASAKARGGLSKRLAQVLVNDPSPLLHHGEVLWRNVGLAMLERGDGDQVTKDWIKSGKWTVEIADEHFPCTVSLRPLYDPKNERIR